MMLAGGVALGFSLVLTLSLAAGSKIRLNAVSIFAVSWSPAVVIFALGDVAEPSPTNETLGMCLVVLVAVTVGSTFGYGACRKTSSIPKNWSGSGAAMPRSESRTLQRVHTKFVILLVGYTLLQLVRAYPSVQQLGGWAAIFDSAGDDFRRAQLLSSVENASTAFSGSTAVLGFASYILFVGHCSIFTGARLWVETRNVRALIPIICCVIYGLAGLQRSAFFIAILLFSVSVVVLNQAGNAIGNSDQDLDLLRQGSRFSRKIGIIAGVVFTCGLLTVPLIARNSNTGNATGLTSLAQYYFSGILGYNSRTVYNPSWLPPPSPGSGNPGDYPGFGAYTFSNLFSVIGRSGIPVPTAPTFYDFYEARLFGLDYVTNTGTSALDFRYDFGVAGAAASFLILASLAGYFHGRTILTHSTWFFPLASYFLVSLCWAFFGNSLLNDFRYIAVAAISAIAVSKTTRCESDVSRPEGRIGR